MRPWRVAALLLCISWGRVTVVDSARAGCVGVHAAGEVAADVLRDREAVGGHERDVAAVSVREAEAFAHEELAGSAPEAKTLAGDTREHAGEERPEAAREATQHRKRSKGLDFPGSLETLARKHNTVWRLEGYTVQGSSRWIRPVRVGGDDTFFVMRRRELTKHNGLIPPVASAYIGVSSINAGIIRHLSLPFQPIVAKDKNFPRGFIALMRMGTFGVAPNSYSADTARRLFHLHLLLLTIGFRPTFNVVGKPRLAPEVSFTQDEIDVASSPKRQRIETGHGRPPKQPRQREVSPTAVNDLQPAARQPAADEDVDMQLLSDGFWDLSDDDEVMTLLTDIANDKVEVGNDPWDSLAGGDSLAPGLGAFDDSNGQQSSADDEVALATSEFTLEDPFFNLEEDFEKLDRNIQRDFSRPPNGTVFLEVPARTPLKPKASPVYLLQFSGTTALLRAMFDDDLSLSILLTMDESVVVESTA